MFCPLNGSGVSPRRRKTLQSAAVINDFPAPLEVPSTMRAGGDFTDADDGGEASDALLVAHLRLESLHPNRPGGLAPSE